MLVNPRIKKGDTVYVLSGKDKGKTGEVLRVERLKGYVFIKGINIQKKHQKPSQQNPGGLIEREGPVHLSSVNLLDKETGKPTRIGVRRNETNKKIRFSKRSQKDIDEK